MGERTGIIWTNHTWNPWQGCHKVSTGCSHCYMYAEKKRYGQRPDVVVRSKPPTFNAPLKWAAPALVFACSWSDFFIEEADPWRPEAWDIIRRTPHLTYQIPTKRPERIAACLPRDWGAGYPNVWLLTSVEDQAAAEKRVLPLLRIPAVVHGISAEPLLGPVNLRDLPSDRPGYRLDAFTGRLTAYELDGAPRPVPGPPSYPRIGWVIVGGQSGYGDVKPMHPDWARALRNQCTASGTAYFFKQWGEWRPQAPPQTAFRLRSDAGQVVTWRSFVVAIPLDANDNPGPVELLERLGTKRAGRELDGRTWDGMPEVKPCP